LSDAALLAVIAIDNKLGTSPILPLPRFIYRTVEERNRKWWENLRTGLIEFILCAADNMAILGTSLLTSAYLDTFLVNANRGSLSVLNFQDMYFTMIVYDCCLASCTHIGSLLAIRGHLHGHVTSTYIRIVLFCIFATALCITIDLSEDAFQAFFVYAERLFILDMHWNETAETILVEYTAPVLAIGYLYWISIHPLLMDERVLAPSWVVLRWLTWPFRSFARLAKKTLKYLEDRNHTWLKTCLHYAIYSHPAAALLTHLVFTGVSISYLLLMKYTKARSPTVEERLNGVGQWCSMSIPGNDRWSYGQWLPLFLLVTPIFTSYLKFYGKFEPESLM
jgi:hypothetical protein